MPRNSYRVGSDRLCVGVSGVDRPLDRAGLLIRRSEEAMLRLARRLARAPQRAIGTAKRLLASQAAGASLATLLDGETAGIVACVGDDDFAEGVQAFLEKRAPAFPSAR